MISLTGRPPTGSYDFILVSPHMDDAAYSAGGRIAQLRRAGKRVLVVTLFGPGTKAPPRPEAATAELGSHAEPRAATKSAHGNISDYTARAAEERAALAVLDVDGVWLDEPELIFRKHSLGEIARLMVPFSPLPWSPLHDSLAASLRALCAAHLAPQGRIAFPLAVGFHPDHRVACDVGRAMHAEGRVATEFYEDIPYNHARPLRALRLRALGVRVPLELLSGTGDITRILLRNSGLLRGLAYLPLLLYLTLLAGLQRLLAATDLRAGDEPPHSVAYDISDAVDTKVSAMRLYPSQTDMFFGPGRAIYDELRRREGAYREYSWTFAPPGANKG